MNGLLAGSVKLIILQFIFSNLKIIPPCIGKKETKKVGITPIAGEQFIPPTDNVFASLFVSDLMENDYQLVDAFSEIRDKAGRKQGVIRFTFAAPDNTEISESFLKTRDMVFKELSKLLSEATWLSCAYLNPFFKAEEVVKDCYAVSINFTARKPLFDGDGICLKEWQRDEKGNKIGQGKVPISTNKFLRISEDNICIVSENP